MKAKLFNFVVLGFLFMGLVLGFTSSQNSFSDDNPAKNHARPNTNLTPKLDKSTKTQSDNNGGNNQVSGIPYYTDNFDGNNDTTSLIARGYYVYYRGAGPQGVTATWYQGSDAVFNAYNGPTTGYVAANYNVVTGTNDIDSWLILPANNTASGDQIVFYARSVTGNPYPDSIRVMYSATGSTTPEGTWVELGRFLAIDDGTWERISYTAPSSGATARFAIRYAVVDGGPSGSNSNYIGIDALTLEGPFPFNNNMKAQAFITPTNGGVVGIGVNFNPQASFTNYGNNNQTAVPVRYIIKNPSNVEIYNQVVNIASIVSGATQTSTFPITSIPSAGTYTIIARSELVGDQDPSDNQITGSVTTAGSLSGDYLIGVPIFNRYSGKNITMEKVVRKVTKQVYEPNSQDRTKDEKANLTETGYANGKLVTKEVEEISWVPMENGVEYTGRLYAENPEDNSDAPGAYATLTAAVNDLNSLGATAAVRFKLTDATYPTETFPITINNYPGNSSVNNLTILPNTGVNATITGSYAGAMIRILGNYVTIEGSNAGTSSRNLTIENTSATSPTCVTVASSGVTPIHHVTVKNCNIINSINATAVVISDAAALGTAGYFNNITIQNNSIQRSYIGVYSIAALAAGNGSNVLITSNNLDVSGANAITYIGIYVQGADGLTVSGNNIANFDALGFQDDKGIWFATGTMNSVIEKNKIHDLTHTNDGGYGGHGVYVSTGTTACNVTIKNNMIWGISGDGWNYTSIPTDNPIGIVMSGTQTGVNVYYNSINLYGNTLDQTSALSMGMFLGTGSTADIRDNSIVNNNGLVAATGTGSCGVYAQTSNAQFTAINYNDYYVNPSGSGVKYLGQIAAVGQTTLAGWKTATAQDLNSISGDPLYISNTDLHIGSASSPLINAGTPIAGITTDIDNKTRSTTTPTIGADEYTFTLNLTLKFQSCPDPSPITVEIRSSVSPYNVVQSVSGTGGGAVSMPIYFSNAVNGVGYYLVVKSVNMIETWSALPNITFTGNTASYNFTTALSQSYQSNQILSGGIPSVYQGDVNQDGFVNTTDVIATYNESSAFITSPATDFNCDGTTDLTDVSLAYNNATNFVQRKRP